MRQRHPTYIDKAHDHVCIIQEVVVLQAGDGRCLRGEDGLVWIGVPVVVHLRGHGVVQVQHEHGGRVVLAVEVRSRPVRQPQDGEDLPLYLPALLASQPAVNEAGVELVVHGKVCETRVGHDAETPN